MKITTFALASTLLVGCASTAGSSAARPVLDRQLAGSSWKLPIAHGRRDGRTIEFKVAGGKYQAVLKDVGNQLGNVAGAYAGVVVMELAPAGAPDVFEGVESTPGQDDRDVTCSLSARGDELKCSNEDWAWLRAS